MKSLLRKNFKVKTLTIRIRKNIPHNQFEFKFSDPFIPQAIKSEIAMQLLMYYNYGKSRTAISTGNNAESAEK